MKDFKVKVPATVANLGPGFDVLGFAVKVYLTVSVSGEEGATVSTDSEDALSDAIISLARKKGRKIPAGFSIRQIENDIPRKSGLGSSAAARVGGVMIADRLLSLKLGSKGIVSEAALLEGHPDNAAPAVAGGLTICYKSGEEFKYSRLDMPDDLKVVLGIPDMEIDTSRAREVMPVKVSLEDAVYSLSRACLLVKVLSEGDYSMLGEAMKDRLHQPHRKKLIPGFDSLVRAAAEAGAYGTAISGSGPCVFSFTGEESGADVGRAMVRAWEEEGIKARYAITEISQEGARIID